MDTQDQDEAELIRGLDRSQLVTRIEQANLTIGMGVGSAARAALTERIRLCIQELQQRRSDALEARSCPLGCTRFQLYCAPGSSAQPNTGLTLVQADAVTEDGSTMADFLRRFDGSVLVHEFEVPFTGDLARRLARVAMQSFAAGAEFSRDVALGALA